MRNDIEYEMIDEGDLYPLTANDQSILTAPVLNQRIHTESERLPRNKEKRNAKVSKTAPYRIVHYDSHLKFLKDNLSTCVTCKLPGVSLEETGTIGIATSLKLDCTTCAKNHEKVYNKHDYLSRKYAIEKEVKKEVENDRKT